MKNLTIDPYLVDTLMRDLVAHDRSSASFLVYLYLYSRTIAVRVKQIAMSHQGLADETGLSKSAVQDALRNLVRRELVLSHRETPTSTPLHSVQRPWRRR